MNRFLVAGMCLSTLLAATLFAAEKSSKPAEKPTTLTAKLIANKDTYTLDPAQAGDAFKKTLKDMEKRLGGRAPAAPKIDVTLQLSNPTDQDITTNLGGDESTITLTLEGAGAVTINPNVAMTMDFRMGAPVTIKPGKTHDIAISSLSSGTRGISQVSYFTEPGEYKLSATLKSNTPDDKSLTLTTEAITLKVTKPDAK